MTKKIIIKIIKVLLPILLGVAVIFGLYLMSIASLFDDMREREYREYSFEIPNSEYNMFVKEWSSFRQSGLEFYLEKEEYQELLAEVSTDECLPFASNKYEFEWNQDSVKVSYLYSGTHWKEITLPIPK